MLNCVALTKYFKISERKIPSRMQELGRFHRGGEPLVGPSGKVRFR